MRLNNKIILVTGASGLLGKAIIEKIRSEQGTCIAADISLSNDPGSDQICCDITNVRSVKETVAAVVSRYGRIDGYVNSAYPRTRDWGTRFEQIDTDSWRTNVDMQLNSAFVIVREVLEAMKPAGRGSIVNLSSIYGMVGPDFSVYEETELTMPAAYSAIKGALINFTRYLASYYGPHNLRVNCVSPGGIFDNQDPLFVQRYEKKVPLKRMGSPKDIAGPVCFLLSDESSYITGHNLVVDGGWTSI